MNLLTLMNIFSFLSQISLATFVLVKNPKSSLNRVGSALIGCFALWSFGAMFMGNHYIPKNVAMLFLNIIFCGAVGFMGLTPWFYFIFTDKKTLLERKIFYGIGLFSPLLFIYLQLRYQAIIEDVQEVSYGWTLVWSPSIWTYLYDFYYFFTIMTAFYLLIDFLRKTKSPIRKKHAMILIMTKGTAFVLGTTTDVLLPQLLKIHNIPVMGNIFVLIWIAGLVYAIARYRLFTVNLATAAENIISTMSDCFILLDPQGTIQLVNKACPNVLRYTENELKGKPLTILLPSDQASNTHLYEMMGGKELKNFYLTLKAKNGSQVPASLSTSILQDEEGNIAGIVWIARDITQHKLTEELLKEAEAKYSTFVERAKDGVAVVQDEVYRFVNRAMAEITGYTVQELLGRPMTELIAPEDRDMISRRYRQRLAGEKVPSFYEAKFLSKDGKIKITELSAAIIQYNERPADMLVIRCITERKRAEQEREKMRIQLFQSQKMEAIGLLAGGVAHDFNNMLTIIQGYNSLAMMKVEEKNPLFSDLLQVEAAAKQAANLTRQLLIFSRKQPTVLTNLNLNKTIDNFSKMLLRLIGEDISITMDLQPDLWLIRADEGNIEQVIMNLAVNARDAMPSGGQLTITTGNITMDEEQARMIPEAQPGQFVRLSISDTGIGMEREIINRIFEPFFTTKEPGRGTGLGLAVVYGIVKQHEGWVTVSSEPGQGTEFSLYFPACFLKPEGEDEEVFSWQDLQGSGERILVVEDEKGVRTLITRVLQENGYLVFAASRAQEALTTFEKEKGNFHLIVSDVILPDLTGLELINRLLLVQPKLKALLISGYADQKVQLPIIYERGYRFLQKPYTSIDLLRTVREIFTKS